MGRRPLPPRHSWHGTGLSTQDAAAWPGLTGLERGGARVLTHTGPLTDVDAVGEFLGEVRDKLGALAGVVHCAGRASSGPAALARKEPGGIRDVLEPKGDGTDILAALTAGDALDFFLLFSSVSAVSPRLAAGLSDYAAANFYLNLRPGYQQRTSRPEFRAVCWPVWRDTGGGTGRPDAAAAAGYGALSDERRPDDPRPGPGRAGARGRGPRARPARRPGPGDLAAARRPAARRPAARAVHSRRSRRLPPGQAPRWLIELFSESLGIPVPQLDTTATFGDLGVESVLLGELLGKLETRVGHPLEPVLLLDYPTVDLLAARLAALFPPAGPRPGSAALPAAAAPSRSMQPRPGQPGRRPAADPARGPGTARTRWLSSAWPAASPARRTWTRSGTCSGAGDAR